MKARIQTLRGEAAYSELTAYLSPDDLAKLETGMAELPASLDSDEALAAAIEQGHWQQLFSAENPNRDHLPFQALRCLRKGLLDNMAFSTSQMFYNIFSHPDNASTQIRVVPIFNQDGEINPQAKNMIDATMRIFSSCKRMYMEQQKREQEAFLASQSLGMLGSDNLLTLLTGVLGQGHEFDTSDWDNPNKTALKSWEPAEEIAFYDLLRQLPVSEQQFLVMPDPHYDGKEFIDESKTTIMREISFRLNFNVFNRFRLSGKPVVMIPARGMMQSFIEAVYPDTAPRAAYRFGLSTVSGLYESMKAGARDMYQSFLPLAHLIPEKLDRLTARLSHAEGELHDFYHQMLAANIPAQDIKMMCDFIDEFYRFAALDKEHSQYAERYAELVLDLEHSSYREKSLNKIRFPSQKFEDRAFKFWGAIEGSEPSQMSEFNDERSREQRNNLAQAFTQYLMENNERFINEYGFMLDTLLDYRTETKYPFLHAVKAGYKTALTQRMMSMSFAELFSSLPDLKESKRMLAQDAIKEKINADMIAAVLYACNVESENISSNIFNYIFNHFQKFIENGQFAALQQQHPEQFDRLVIALKSSKYVERNLKFAVQQYHQNPLAFNMLYDEKKVNQVFGESGATLLYLAAKYQHVELLMRLTSDGAIVTRVAGSQKPSAMRKAIDLGREDIQALLILAKMLGPNWMQQMPAAAARLHRLADDHQNASGIALLEKDKAWVKKITSELPAEIKQALEDENKHKPTLRKSIFSEEMPPQFRGMLSAVMQVMAHK